MEYDSDASGSEALIASAREYVKRTSSGCVSAAQKTPAPSPLGQDMNLKTRTAAATTSSPPPSDNKCSLSLRLEIGRLSSATETPAYSNVDILLALGNYISPKKILSLGKLRALDHWSLALVDTETYDKVLDIPELIVAGRPVEVSILSQALAKCRVQWLPTQLDNADIVSCFTKYGRVHNFWVETLREEGFTHILTGIRGFDIELKDGVKREDLPHIFKVHGYEGLLVVKGRAPKCLRCSAIGHISRSCPRRLAPLAKPSFAETAALAESNFPPLPRQTSRSKVTVTQPALMAAKVPPPAVAPAANACNDEPTEPLDFSFISPSLSRCPSSRASSPEAPAPATRSTTSAAEFLKTDSTPSSRLSSRKKKRRSTPEKKGPFEGQKTDSLSRPSSASGVTTTISSSRTTKQHYPDWTVDQDSM